MSREKAKAELNALTIQVTNDEKYIVQVAQELTDKKNEWKDQDFEYETEKKEDDQQIVTDRGYIYDDRGVRQ
eukprot:2743195-Heterocapsa_arctica.AAC.1